MFSTTDLIGPLADREITLSSSQVLGATLSAHRLAAFDVDVLAGRCW
jgi:hypothetical protein